MQVLALDADQTPIDSDTAAVRVDGRVYFVIGHGHEGSGRVRFDPQRDDDATIDVVVYGVSDGERSGVWAARVGTAG